MKEIRIFKFDPKIDILSYYKPYLLQNLDFNTVKQMLIKIKEDDPYLDFSQAKYIKINGFSVKLDDEIDFKKFDDTIYISPLCEKNSYKDLNINMDDFYAKLLPFKDMINNDDKAFYDTLFANFYANKIVHFTDKFLGNSAFIFARYLSEKYLDKKGEILDIMKSQMAYYRPGDFLNVEEEENKGFVYFCNKLGFKFDDDKKILDTNVLDKYEISNFEPKFTNFNIAVYNDKQCQNLAKKFGGKIIKFDLQNDDILQNVNEIYKFDKDCALRLAGEILFDAFDNGADFLLVNSEFAFKFFDENVDKIETLFGRKFIDFYILKMDEFLELLQGKSLASLKEHKLKVSLV